MKVFGHKARLCFEVGDKLVGGLLPMEIWAANESITPFDKHAYLPAFIASLKAELEAISKGDIPKNFIYFNHGPTTDDVHGEIVISGGFAKLTFEFTEENIVSVNIGVSELVTLYNEVLQYLRGLNA